MLLVDQGIRRAMQAGGVVIYPFHEEQLNNGSYDLTLGPFIYRYREPDMLPPSFDDPEIVDVGSVDEVRRMFRPEPEDSRALNDVVELAPKERVLAHSNEFIGGTVGYRASGKYKLPFAVNTHLQATSTAARIGITACMCAGWGDVGFINRWTFEVENRTRFTLHVPVGSVIAQLVFEETEPPEKLYHERGSYQSLVNLDELVRSWKPEDMLPKRIKVKTFWKGLYDNKDTDGGAPRREGNLEREGT